jgi:hypothetical protein
LAVSEKTGIVAVGRFDVLFAAFQLFDAFCDGGDFVLQVLGVVFQFFDLFCFCHEMSFEVSISVVATAAFAIFMVCPTTALIMHILLPTAITIRSKAFKLSSLWLNSNYVKRKQAQRNSA